MKIYAAVFAGRNPSTGTEQNLFFCSGTGYENGGQWYEPRIMQPALFRRSISLTGLNRQASAESSIGELVLANIDGALDYLQDWAFDGRGIAISVGDDVTGGFVTVVNARIETVLFSWSEVTVRIRDRVAELADKPALTERYAGTNSGGNGVEGTASDIKGLVKPLALGSLMNVPTVQVNTSKLIFQASTSVGVDVVTSFVAIGGVFLSGTEVANVETAAAPTPGSGVYTWDRRGYFRLPDTPARDVTAWIDTTGAGAGSIIKLLAKQGGLIESDFTAADITALDTAFPNLRCGYYVGDESTVGQALDAFCGGLGAWWWFDGAGKFRVKQFAAPSGTPVAVFDQDNIVKIEMEKGGAVPVYEVVAIYTVNWHQMDRSALAGSVDQATASWFASEGFRMTATDASVQTVHPTAEKLEITTHITNNTGGNVLSEATRQLNLFKVVRTTLNISVHIDDSQASVLDLGAVVQVKLPRFGMTNGKLFTIIGIMTDLQKNQVELTLWG